MDPSMFTPEMIVRRDARAPRRDANARAMTTATRRKIARRRERARDASERLTERRIARLERERRRKRNR
jgi:hypothetical protein